jgi:iron(III) transport system permease protein
LLLVVAVAVITAFTLIPVGFVGWFVMATGPDALGQLLFRPRIGELLTNTVLLILIAVPLCVSVGVGGAWLVERTTLPLRRVWSVLQVVPLAIPAFVVSYAWASTVPAFGGLAGGVLIAVLAYSGLVYLPALATLRRLDPALEDVARSLGHSNARVFWTVVIPQLRYAISGGALLVGLHLLAEYGAFAQIRFETFTTAIVVQYSSAFAGPVANAMGAIVAVLALLMLTTDSLARGRVKFARTGSGAPLPAQRTVLAPLAGVLLTVALALYASLSVAVPTATTGRWLLGGPWWDQRWLGDALVTTVILAVSGAAVTSAVALVLAWLGVRYPGRATRVLESANFVASSFPSIIVALALVTVTLRVLPVAYQTVFTVLAAYLILFLPRAVVSIRSGLAQAPPIREEASRTLGQSPVRTLLRVTAPAIMPSVLAGAALAGIGMASELTATLLLAPNGTRTLATEFWSASTSVQYVDAAPYAVLLTVISIPAVALMYRQARKRTA